VALATCRECGKEVSTEAKTCPHCGVTNPVPSTSKASPVALIGCAVLIVGVVGYCSYLGEEIRTNGPGVPSSAARGYAIEYSVSGLTTEASVTYENEQGGTQQEKVVVPWHKSFTASSGKFLYLSAQNGRDFGGIVATIRVDGQDFKKSQSEGGYVIATASGTCCR